MEPFRFADILFIFLTLVITLTILYFVNKAKVKGREAKENTPSEPKDTAVAEEKEK